MASTAACLRYRPIEHSRQSLISPLPCLKSNSCSSSRNFPNQADERACVILGVRMKELDLADTLGKLMRIESPTGEEREVGLYLEELLRSLGFLVSRQEVGRSRFNLWARTDATPHILFCTHMDTVLPRIPFRQQDGRIFGRGACDAKGALVAMLQASLRLRARGFDRIGLLFVVGEEVNSDGARAAATETSQARFIILGEPTENRLAAGQKGTLVFRLMHRGEAGHSAYPGKGKSAIHALVSRMERWLSREWGSSDLFGRTTLNLGKISGGTGANVIADRAEVEGIFRVATSVRAILETIAGEGEADGGLEIRSSAEPMELFVPPGYPAEVVWFGSDAPHLRSLAPVVMCGPGSIRHAHRPDEQIALSEVEQAVKLYVQLAEELAGAEEG